MYKINNNDIKIGKAYMIFGNAWMQKQNEEKIEKYSPRIWVEGLDDNNRMMVETFISDVELNDLNVGEELDLKEYITDLIFFSGPDFGSAEFLGDGSESTKVIITKIAENKFNIKANIETINLIYDVDICI